jgi:omega-6 fatty acid desaturase (delta-12 desaturase)
MIGPAYQFFVLHRFPTNLPRAWRREWRSVWLTNIALAGMIMCASWLLGLVPFVLVHLPITWLAGSIGVWLFYVQHQFEQTYWAPSAEWVFEEACLSGSSYLDLPPWLHWCTGHIGVHHVHHLCPQIPNYRLRRTVDAHPSLRRATRLGLRDMLACFRLKLWDEDRNQLVGWQALVSARRDPQDQPTR